MFGYEQHGKRKLITVTPRQAEALFLFVQHYDVLGALLTLTNAEITEAMARGYQTEEESG